MNNTKSPTTIVTHLSSLNITDSNMAKNINTVQLLEMEPTTVKIVEFLTGLIASGIENPASLVISGGHIVQSILKGELKQQLFDEIQELRKKGKIKDDDLNSSYAKSTFIEMLKSIDNEDLDENKFRALKSIFISSVLTGENNQNQMLAYQYFLICKKLSSIDVIILKTAFEVYKEPGSNQRLGGIHEWQKMISDKIGIPIEVVSQSRIENSGASQNRKTMIFDTDATTRHGLTSLGIEIGKYMNL